MTTFDASKHPRTASGTPDGGQFSTVARPEPALGLSQSRAAERQAELEAMGYVRATAVPTVLDPRERRGRAQWWKSSTVTAEYGRGVPKMPEDYTPSMGAGQATSGRRRTTRRLYTGAGVAVRMPSAAAVRRYAAEGNGTFDIPVSAEVANADGTTRTVQTWVRVAARGDGTRFDAYALGEGDPEMRHRLGEAVSAVLEARRPTVALEAAGDLIARRAERRAVSGIRQEPMDSSWIDAVGYDRATGVMTMVSSKEKRPYAYVVPEATYEAIRTSQSPGRTYNQLVRNKAERLEVTRCERCERVTPAHLTHSCAVPMAAAGGADRRAETPMRERALRALTGLGQKISGASRR